MLPMCTRRARIRLGSDNDRHRVGLGLGTRRNARDCRAGVVTSSWGLQPHEPMDDEKHRPEPTTRLT